jgi:hypothetical protein
MNRREATTEISPAQRAGSVVQNRFRPERTLENLFMPSSVLSGRLLLEQLHQPLCGWLISGVASRQNYL